MRRMSASAGEGITLETPVQILRNPIRIILPGSHETVQICVDDIVRVGKDIAVYAWSSAPVDWVLRVDGEPAELSRASFVVAPSGDNSSEQFGVALLVHSESDELEFGIRNHPGVFTVGQIPDIDGDVDAKRASEELISLLGQIPPFTEVWSALVPLISGFAPSGEKARGHLEFAAVVPRGSQAVIVGWWTQTEDLPAVWLEVPGGTPVDVLTSFRCPRDDVQEAFRSSYPKTSARPGFVAVVNGAAAGDTVTLRAQTSDGIVDLMSMEIAVLPELPKDLAAMAFGFAPEMMRFGEYSKKVLIPLVTDSLEVFQQQWDLAPTYTRDFGALPESPRVSIIVPLYGRIDFVEHQLLEFSRDPWIRENAEIINVLDDPSLQERLLAECSTHHKLYGMPFRIVWSPLNRGFSGANNVGARHASGQELLFLNSDVFPREPGWLERMSETLETDEKTGIVGARLLFAGGGLQHAGMQSLWKDDLQVWINHHPYSGLDPKLDPSGEEPAVAQAVTGACLLISRELFDQIEGWDTGYLVGDFEDSDLCYKVRDAGYDVVYEPRAVLTHLERQSFGLLGGGDFRFRVTLLNAFRHQGRWLHILEGGDHGHSAA